VITGLNVYNIVSAVAMRRRLPLGAIHFGPMHPAEATSPNSPPVGTMTVRTSLNPFIDSCSQPNQGPNDRFGSTYPSNLGLDLSPVLKSSGSNLSSGPNGGTTITKSTKKIRSCSRIWRAYVRNYNYRSSEKGLSDHVL